VGVSKDWFVADKAGLKNQAKEIGVARTIVVLTNLIRMSYNGRHSQILRCNGANHQTRSVTC